MKIDYFKIPEITISYKDNVKTSEKAVVTSSQDAAKILSVAFENCMEHHEEVYVLFLNKACRVLGISNVSKGGIDRSTIDIRIILQTALKSSCSSILLAHNHPSGSIRPSSDDLAMTKIIQKGCEAIGIKFLDHVIMSEENYCSFADEGLL
jgi:DNA repair protein RadC